MKYFFKTRIFSENHEHFFKQEHFLIPKQNVETQTFFETCDQNWEHKKIETPEKKLKHEHFLKN